MKQANGAIVFGQWTLFLQRLSETRRAFERLVLECISYLGIDQFLEDMQGILKIIAKEVIFWLSQQ